jgi:lipoate-protein ligase A
LLCHPAEDGAWNMAVDEAVARAVGAKAAPPTLRFYAWRRPTISLGYLQSVGAAPLVGVCRRYEVPIVRRPTGGRAVLHDAELTYSVAVPQEGEWGQLSVSESYARFGEALLAGLAGFGISASLGEPDATAVREGRGVACFSQRRLPAIVVQGRKLIGSAQRRWEGAVLQQGSILIRFDADFHARLFVDWPREEARRSIVGLSSLLGSVESERLQRGLAAGWEQALGVDLEAGELSRDECEEARCLRDERYGSAEWTYRR